MAGFTMEHPQNARAENVKANHRIFISVQHYWLKLPEWETDQNSDGDRCRAAVDRRNPAPLSNHRRSSRADAARSSRPRDSCPRRGIDKPAGQRARIA